MECGEPEVKDSTINEDFRINIVQRINTDACEILSRDYIATVNSLRGMELFYMRLSIILAISAFFFTGLGSVLAFSAGYIEYRYMAYIAGCCNVIAMMFLKASYYANGQSHYHDAKLKNHLTKDYKFLYKFIMNPLTLSPVNDPKMPDPTGDSNFMASDSKSGPALGQTTRVAQTPKYPWSTPRVSHTMSGNIESYGIPKLNMENTRMSSDKKGSSSPFIRRTLTNDERV
jgi:hypothetical protein